MALPTTVGSLNTAKLNSMEQYPKVGPFKSSAGNIYVLGRDSATATTLRAMKATDPTSSFSSIATKTGFTTAILWLSAYQVGDVLHLIVSDGATGNPASINYKYQTFNMSSDTFVTAETIASALATGNHTGSAVCLRSGGEVVVAFSGAQTKKSGTNYSRTYYSRRTGVNTWSAATMYSTSDGSNSISPGLSLGVSDQVALLLANNATLTDYVNVLSSSNTLGGLVDLANATNVSSVSWISQVCYTLSSTMRAIVSRVWFAGGTPQYAYFDNGVSSPTGTAVNQPVAATFGCLMYYDANTDITYYVGVTNGTTPVVTVFASTDHGATWDGGTTAHTGTGGSTTLCIAAWCPVVYTRGGGSVIAFVVNDNGTLKYNEFSIGAVTNNKTVTVASPQTVSRTAGALKTETVPTFTLAEIVTNTRLVPLAKTFSIGLAGVFSILKRVGKNILMQTNAYQLDALPNTYQATKGWKCIDCSADGQIVVATSQSAGTIGEVWTSTDGGASWTNRGAIGTGSGQYHVCAVSADGTHMVVVEGAKRILGSTDNGASWSNISPSDMSFNDILISADGSKIVAVPSTGGDIFTSSFDGSTWTNVTSGDTNLHGKNYFQIAGDPTLTNLIVVFGSGTQPYISNSSGAAGTWNAVTDLSSSGYWTGCACSENFKYVYAAWTNERLYRSDNYGQAGSWIPITTGNHVPGTSAFWGDLRSNPDGSILVEACSGSAGIMVSTDYGVNWAQAGSVSLVSGWNKIGLTSDGLTIFSTSNGNAQLSLYGGTAAAVGKSKLTGQQKHLRPSNPIVSWAETITLARSFVSGQPTKILTIAIPTAISLVRSIRHTVSVLIAEAIVEAELASKNIAMTSPQTITKIVRQSKNVPTTSVQSVTLTRIKSLGVTITMASAQALSLLKGVAHTIALATAQIVTKLDRTPKNINISSSQMVTKVSQIQRTIAAQLSQAVVLNFLKDLSATITLAQSQVTTLLRAVSYNFTIVIPLSQLMSYIKRTSHQVTVSIQETVVLVRTLAKIVLSTSNQILTMARQTGNSVSVAITSTLSVAMLKAFNRAILVTIGQAITGTILATQTITVQYSGLSSTVTLIKSTTKAILLGLSSVVTTAKTTVRGIIISTQNLVSLTTSFISGAVQNSKTITVTQTSTLSLLRGVGHAITNLTGSSVILALKSTFTKLVQWASSEIVTLTRKSSFTKAILALIPETVTLAAKSSFGKLLSIASPQTIILATKSSFGKLISLTSPQIIALGRRTSKFVAIGLSQLSTLVLKASFLRTILVTSSQTITLTKKSAKSLILSITSTVTTTRTKAALWLISIASAQTASLSRTTTKLITLIQTSALVLLRSTGKIIAILLPEFLSLDRGGTKTPENINISSAETITLTKLSRFVRLATVLTSLTVSLKTRTARTITFVIPSSVTLGKMASKIVSKISSPETVTTTRLRQRTKTITTILSAETVRLVRSVRITISTTIAPIATLSRKIVHLITLATTQIWSLNSRIGKTITRITSPEVVSLARTKLLLRTILITQSQSIALTAIAAVAWTVQLVQSQTLNLGRTISRTILSAKNQAILLTTAVSKTINIALTSVIELTTAGAVKATIVFTTGLSTLLSKTTIKNILVGWFNVITTLLEKIYGFVSHEHETELTGIKRADFAASVSKPTSEFTAEKVTLPIELSSLVDEQSFNAEKLATAEFNAIKRAPVESSGVAETLTEEDVGA